MVLVAKVVHQASKYITLCHKNWNAPRRPPDKGSWIEPVQVYAQEYAIYLANLIHVDSRAVIKVVYGTTLACFPNKETVDRVERQIARQQEQK